MMWTNPYNIAVDIVVVFVSAILWKFERIERPFTVGELIVIRGELWDGKLNLLSNMSHSQNLHSSVTRPRCTPVIFKSGIGPDLKECVERNNVEENRK